MTKAEILTKYPNASASFIRRNASDAGGEVSRAEPQQVVRDALPPAVKRTAPNRTRYAVRITSFRSRLIDPDNLCGKFFTDCLRYAGLIPDDTAAIMDYSIRQQKTSKDQERTEITLTPIS